MNYFNLALALFVGAAALHYLGTILRTGFTNADYQSNWGLTLDAIGFATLAALSVWNFNLAVAA